MPENNLLIIEDTDGNPANISLLNLATEVGDGIAALRGLVKNDPAAVVALLIPEGMVDPDIIAKAIRAGAKAYIKKPTSSEEIRRHLARLLERVEEIR